MKKKGQFMGKKQGYVSVGAMPMVPTEPSSQDTRHHFWMAFSSVFEGVFSVKKTISDQVKHALEFLGISGVIDGFTYGSFGWIIGSKVGTWFGTESLFFPILFAIGASFSAGIFGINNVHREYQSLVYWSPNRSIRQVELVLSRVLSSSIELIAAWLQRLLKIGLCPLYLWCDIREIDF